MTVDDSILAHTPSADRLATKLIEQRSVQFGVTRRILVVADHSGEYLKHSNFYLVNIRFLPPLLPQLANKLR